MRGYRDGALQVAIGGAEDSGGAGKPGETDSPGKRGEMSGRAYALRLRRAGESLGLREFGYESVTVTGEMRLAFEVSRLQSRGEKESYEVVFASTVGEGEWADIGARGRTVTVEGWLSPAGSYGHMNFAKHQLVVTAFRDASVVRPVRGAE